MDKPDYDVWVDYNDIDGNRNVVGYVEETFKEFEYAEAVLTGDNEGNRCNGNVLEQRGNVVFLKLDMSTFKESSNG